MNNSEKSENTEKGYYVRIKKNGKVTSWLFIKANNRSECEKYIRSKGFTILWIFSARNNHICQNCKQLTDGRDKNLLCKDCRNKLGRTFFSVLGKKTKKEKKADEFVELMLDYMKDRLNYYAKVYLKNSLSDIKWDFRQHTLDEAYNGINYNFELNFIIHTLKQARKDGIDFNSYYRDLNKFHLPKFKKSIAEEIKSIIKNQAEKLGRSVTAV